MGIQRTGTILLCSSLNQHPEILSLDEIFVNHPRYKPGMIAAFRDYVVESGKSNAPVLINHKRTIYKYLNQFYSLPDYKARGFKLMANQADHLTYIKKYLIKQKVKIIKMTRANVFKIFLSRYRAEQTGLFHSRQKRIAKDIPRLTKTLVKLPVDRLISELESIERENRQLDCIVESLRIPTITVTYESLVENFTTSIKDVLSFLEVNPDITIEPARKKISPHQLSESIENYEDVRSVLSGTKFEHYLE
jgi:LPS sulfotransferase NodH